MDAARGTPLRSEFACKVKRTPHGNKFLCEQKGGGLTQPEVLIYTRSFLVPTDYSFPGVKQISHTMYPTVATLGPSANVEASVARDTRDELTLAFNTSTPFSFRFASHHFWLSLMTSCIAATQSSDSAEFHVLTSRLAVSLPPRSGHHVTRSSTHAPTDWSPGLGVESHWKQTILDPSPFQRSRQQFPPPPPPASFCFLFRMFCLLLFVHIWNLLCRT